MTRLWTLAEANAAIPKVRTMLVDARIVMQTVQDIDDNLEDLQIIGQEDSQEARDLLVDRGQAMAGLAKILQRFAAMGCEVKDVKQGLVDFRGDLGGTTVYLCWRDGEERVTHYHALDTGFAGRKPIPGAT